MIHDLNVFKYIVVKNFFDLKDIDRMAKRMITLRNHGQLQMDDQCPKSFSIYGDPIHSEIQEKYRGKLEQTIEQTVFPTYTYARIYSPKEVLAYHTDRPACEISITATLDYDTFDGKPWPIYVERKDGFDWVGIIDEHSKEIRNVNANKYYLEKGDALIYLGCEIAHFRTEFIGVFQSQVFLHYVDATGPYKHWKYDGRPTLGSSVHTKRNIEEPIDFNVQYRLGI